MGFPNLVSVLTYAYILKSCILKKITLRVHGIKVLNPANIPNLTLPVRFRQITHWGFSPLDFI